MTYPLRLWVAEKWWMQAMARSYGLDEEIDMSELDAELDAIDEQLSLEAEVHVA